MANRMKINEVVAKYRESITRLRQEYCYGPSEQSDVDLFVEPLRLRQSLRDRYRRNREEFAPDIIPELRFYSAELSKLYLDYLSNHGNKLLEETTDAFESYKASKEAYYDYRELLTNAMQVVGISNYQSETHSVALTKSMKISLPSASSGNNHQLIEALKQSGEYENAIKIDKTSLRRIMMNAMGRSNRDLLSAVIATCDPQAVDLLRLSERPIELAWEQLKKSPRIPYNKSIEEAAVEAIAAKVAPQGSANIESEEECFSPLDEEDLAPWIDDAEYLDRLMRADMDGPDETWGGTFIAGSDDPPEDEDENDRRHDQNHEW